MQYDNLFTEGCSGVGNYSYWFLTPELLICELSDENFRIFTFKSTLFRKKSKNQTQLEKVIKNIRLFLLEDLSI